jgi:EmrB/QacA subfamily drug resistance transporter
VGLKLTRRQRFTVIGASLVALFLGALDALIISAAMPSVVADLGGLHLYSWVYSAYFLSRAVSLPIVGKMADLYKNRNLFMVAVGTFLASSTAAGCAWSMTALIIARVIQGIGAGAIFALVYTVLADISAPENRGRTLSLASFTWGLASVLGPTLGGIIVSYFSWRWIFFINIPLGIACLWGIGAHLEEVRTKTKEVSLDLWGAASLTTTVLAFLFLLMTGGRNSPWLSPGMIALALLSVTGLIAFILVERRTKDPILSIGFFKKRSFTTGNGAIFLSSFTIFSLFAFAPLFIQGAQLRSPMQVGMAMLSLSLGWSMGSVALGQVIDRVGRKFCAVAGAVCLIMGCAMTLAFTAESTMIFIFCSFFIVGVGMGFVALATLLVVQSGLDQRDLGVATSSNQFARTLGGAVGVGVCGGLVANRFSDLTKMVRDAGIVDGLSIIKGENSLGEIGQLFNPAVQAAMPANLKQIVQETVTRGVGDVFWTVTISATLCLLICLLLPSGRCFKG